MTINGSKLLWAAGLVLFTILGWGGNKVFDHLIRDSEERTQILERLSRLEEKVSLIYDLVKK